MDETVIPARFAAAGGDIAAAAMGRSMFEMSLGSRLTFAGRLDPDVLARATRLLLDLEPVLGCWYDERLRGAEWVRCEGLDHAAPFTVATSADPDSDAAVFHATPFDPKGPRLAVRLLRSAEDDDVCVRLDHVAGDGWSAKEVTHLLAETYTHLLADPSYEPTARLSPRPDHADAWDALTAEQRAAAATAPRMEVSKWRIKAPRGDGSRFVVRTLTLPARRVAAIRAYAHERGATVNEALIAAVVRSAAAMFPQREGTRAGVSVSADPRRFAGDLRLDRIAMIATTQTVLVDYNRGESLDETLRHVVDGVRPWRDSLWGIGGVRRAAPPPIALRGVFGLMTTLMRVTNAAGLVTMNVGAFDDHRLGFGSAHPTSAVCTGPIPRFAGFPALISSYRDTLTLWMGFREKNVSAETVERFLCGIEAELAEASDASTSSTVLRLEIRS